MQAKILQRMAIVRLTTAQRLSSRLKLQHVKITSL
jgi:hypothetical protein